jgi:hypothetical protein
MNSKGWIDQQVEKARKEIGSWPTWMAETARFSGGNQEVGAGPPSAQGCSALMSKQAVPDESGK